MRKSKRNVTRISKINKIATGKVKRRTAEGRSRNGHDYVTTMWKSRNADVKKRKEK
jgi:hypothetical protein